MVFIIIGVLMVLGCIVSNSNEITNKKLYTFFMIVLWLLLAFRYGQGSDYFNYKYLFGTVNSFYDVIFNPSNEHGEIGFRLLYWIFGNCFEAMVFFIATFEMIMLHLFITKNSSNRMISLTLFYPVYYLVYYYSALRQGFAMAVFLGILLEYLKKRKFVQYFIGVIAVVLFHSSAIVLAALPLVYLLSMKVCYIIFAGAFVLGNFIGLLQGIGPIGTYWSGSVSVMALMARMFVFACFLLLFYHRDKSMDTPEFLLEAKIFIIAFAFYTLFMKAPTIASRTTAYYLVIEVIVFTHLIRSSRGYKNIIYVLLMVFMLFNTYRTISANLIQGSYFEDVSVAEYPYISIMNKDDLWDYREFPPIPYDEGRSIKPDWD